MHFIFLLFLFFGILLPTPRLMCLFMLPKNVHTAYILQLVSNFILLNLETNKLKAIIINLPGLCLDILFVDLIL